MQEKWIRIMARLRELGCLEAMDLQPGASLNEIEALEGHLGVRFPRSVRDFIGVHNGQNGFGLLFGHEFLSIKGIQQQWDNWRSLDESSMNQDCAEFQSSDPAGFIKPLYCNKGWIPLTHDGGGNHFGLDLDPDRLGTSGQIIAFGRDEDTKRLLATSFESFVEDTILWLGLATWDGECLEAPVGC